jgi:hypothetical protein
MVEQWGCLGRRWGLEQDKPPERRSHRRSVLASGSRDLGNVAVVLKVLRFVVLPIEFVFRRIVLTRLAAERLGEWQARAELLGRKPRP